MTRLILYILLLISPAAVSAGGDRFVAIDFGTPRTETVSTLRTLLGEPREQTSDALTYRDVTLGGCTFSRAVFGFEEETRGGYFNEVRLFITAPSRRAAVEKREMLVRSLKDRYPITADYEENGNKFYKGGTSPTGIGFLFTVYTQRRGGVWTTELRYGAFHKLKRD